MGASIATALSALPPFLLGSLLPVIRDDVSLSTSGLGILVSIYSVAGAVTALPGGRLAERLGPRRGLLATATVTSLSLAGIGLLVSEWWHLALFVAMAGAANGMVHPAGNLAIMLGVPFERRGWAFGLKQAAPPLATLFAGLALPLLAFTLGWQGTFLIGIALLPLVAAILPPDSRARAPGSTVTIRLTERRLILTAVASALAFGSATTIGAFLVDGAVQGGRTPTMAGLTLTVASVACIAVRVTIGWRTDKMRNPSLALVAGLIGVGALGLAVLSSGPGEIWPLGAVIALAAGWGWPGLLYHSVSSSHEEAPAAATAVITTGNTAGAAFGPLLFGLIAHRLSFQFAWMFSAILMASASALMLHVSRLRERQSALR